jgi:hypothetical protein
MNRKLKVVSLALMLAMALAAVLASAASAQFTSNKEHTILSGSQKTGTNDIFSAGEGFGGITCENGSYSGTAVNKSEPTQVLSTSLENCKDSFGRTGDIHCTLCSLTQTSGANKGTIHIVGGTAATITSGGSVVCTMTFANPQTNIGVTYTNLGGTKGVEITRHTTNLISTTSGGFFNCGIANGEHKAGTFDSTIVITGKDTSGAAAEISVD